MDKLCHDDQFRLRLLVTDTCNLSCKYCLNDFQRSKNNNKMLDVNVGTTLIKKYMQFVQFIGSHNPIITISGGEPGLYPDLFKLLQCVKLQSEAAINIVCTNGKIFSHPSWKLIDAEKLINFLHIHIFPGTFIDFKKLTNATPVVQMVFTEDVPESVYEDMIQYYNDYQIKFKLFVNYYGEDDLFDNYERFCNEMSSKYSNFTSRFTGIQQNRGIGCKDCDRICVTLKGIWMFPNGKMTTCPQVSESNLVHIDDVNLPEYITDAYKFHKSIEEKS